MILLICIHFFGPNCELLKFSFQQTSSFCTFLIQVQNVHHHHTKAMNTEVVFKKIRYQCTLLPLLYGRKGKQEKWFIFKLSFNEWEADQFSCSRLDAWNSKLGHTESVTSLLLQHPPQMQVASGHPMVQPALMLALPLISTWLHHCLPSSGQTEGNISFLPQPCSAGSVSSHLNRKPVDSVIKCTYLTHFFCSSIAKDRLLC